MKMEMGEIYTFFIELVMGFGIGGHDMFEFIEEHLKFLTQI